MRRRKDQLSAQQVRETTRPVLFLLLGISNSKCVVLLLRRRCIAFHFNGWEKNSGRDKTHICIFHCSIQGMREHYVCDTEVNLCYSNPCANGGTCLRKEGGYTCQCRPGFAGQECQMDLASLSKKDKSCTKAGCPLSSSGALTALTANCTGPSYFFTPTLCQLRSRSFYRGSFLTFPALRQRYRLHVKLR